MTTENVSLSFSEKQLENFIENYIKKNLEVIVEADFSEGDDGCGPSVSVQVRLELNGKTFSHSYN